MTKTCPEHGRRKCVLCGGLGWLVKDTFGRAGNLIASGTVECPACEGLGKVPDTSLALCGESLGGGSNLFREIPMFIGSN